MRNCYEFRRKGSWPNRAAIHILEGLRKITKYFGEDSHCCNQDSNRVSSIDKSRALMLHQSAPSKVILI
jgi:hypothetical protein